MSTVPAAILGPTGYTGLELIEILSRHPSMRAAYLATARENQPRIDAEFPRLAGRIDPAVARCRAAERPETAPRIHEPPRRTLRAGESVATPKGSVAGRASHGAYSSAHHM